MININYDWPETSWDMGDHTYVTISSYKAAVGIMSSVDTHVGAMPSNVDTQMIQTVKTIFISSHFISLSSQSQASLRKDALSEG